MVVRVEREHPTTKIDIISICELGDILNYEYQTPRELEDEGTVY